MAPGRENGDEKATVWRWHNRFGSEVQTREVGKYEEQIV